MANNKARSAGVQAAGKRSVTSVTPKKTALTKDFTRSISHSKGRFVSIMALIALGTFALVGLFAAGPDMRATGTQYFGDYDVADISIISDYGLDEDDQAAIEEVSGVRQIEYGYFKDVVVEGTITSVRVYSAPTNVSQFEVTEGRLPEAEDEIALYSGLADDYDIGDAFVVEETADLLTGETTLTRTEFTVVGFVNSSEILSTLSMGQSTSGTGSLKGYAVASADVFDSDVYMVARITFDDTQALNPYGTAYRDAVQAHKEELAELLADRPALRLAAVKADYQEGIDDAQAEVDDAKAEVEDARQQLADAKSQLDDAAAQISDAKQQIADSVAELLAAVAEGQDELDAAWAELQDAATQLSSARSQLAAAADQIAEAEEALADGEAQVAAAQAALDEAKAELDSSLDTLTASQAEYDEKLAEYEASYAEYEAGEDAYAEAYDQYEASLATYEQGVAALEEFESKFNTSPSDLLSVLGQLDDEQVLSYLASAGILIEGSDVSAYLSQLQELADFEQSQATYEAQLDAAQEELAANRAALDAAKTQLAAAKAELDSAAASLEAGWATYNAYLVDYEDGADTLAASQDTLDEKASELAAAKASYNASVAEYNEGVSTYEEGLASYYAGMAELDSSEASGWSQIDDAQAEVDDAEAEYLEGLEEYEGSLPDAEDEIADAEDQIADAEDEIADAEETLALLETSAYEIDSRREWYGSDGYVIYSTVADIVDSLAKVFPVFLYLVAALVTLSTMTRFVDEERGTCGTLKALGYSDVYIAKKFLLYGLIAGGVGAIVGIVAGHVVIPLIVYEAYRDSMVLPPITLQFYPVVSLVAFALAMVSSVLPAWVAVKAQLKAKPAELLRAKPPASGSRIFLERVTPIWNRMNFTNKVSARNLFRYKQRAFMTIFGVAGAACLMVAGFGVQASIGGMGEKQFGSITKYDMIVVNTTYAGEDDLAEEEELLASDGVEDYADVYYESVSKVAGDNGDRQDITLLVPEDADELETYVSLAERKSGEAIELGDSGCVISERLATLLGVETGDVIEFEDAEGETREVEVTGICEMYMGHFMFMSPSAYEEVFGEDYEPNGYLATLGDDSEGSVDEWSSTFMELDAVRTVMQNTSLEDMVGITFLLYFVVQRRLRRVDMLEALKSVD